MTTYIRFSMPETWNHFIIVGVIKQIFQLIIWMGFDSFFHFVHMYEQLLKHAYYENLSQFKRMCIYIYILCTLPTTYFFSFHSCKMSHILVYQRTKALIFSFYFPEIFWIYQIFCSLFSFTVCMWEKTKGVAIKTLNEVMKNVFLKFISLSFSVPLPYTDKE